MDKKVLHVVDMSPCIYAGSFNRHSFIQGDILNTGNGYRERNIPTGGASMLFNILGQYMAQALSPSWRTGTRPSRRTSTLTTRVRVRTPTTCPWEKMSQSTF